MSDKICFVICPIGEEGSDTRKRSDTVLKHFIEPVCQSFDYNVVRVDKLVTVDRIDNTITEYLESADLVIADLTELNPNAFYEFGYRQALKLPLIPIIQEGHEIPFDVRSLRTIFYVTDDIDKVEAIKDRLSETINTFAQVEASEISEDHNSSAVRMEASSLLNIHDKLDQIIELLHTRNDELVDTVSSQVAKYAHPQKDAETALMETFMPIFLEDPEKILKFMDFAQKYGDK